MKKIREAIKNSKPWVRILLTVLILITFPIWIIPAVTIFAFALIGSLLYYEISGQNDI